MNDTEIQDIRRANAADIALRLFEVLPDIGKLEWDGYELTVWYYMSTDRDDLAPWPNSPSSYIYGSKTRIILEAFQALYEKHDHEPQAWVAKPFGSTKREYYINVQS